MTSRPREPDPRPRAPRALSILLILVPLAAMVIAVALFATTLRPQPQHTPDPSAASTKTSPAVARSDASPASSPLPVATPETAAASVAPQTPWLSLPATTTLTRIAVGSCLDQGKPQPIWTAIRAAAPQLMLMIGDNVYGDVRGNDVTPLIAAYRRQLAHPEFAAARATLPMLGVWDDHDYGRNDAGAEFSVKSETARLFREFWQLASPPAQSDGAIYRSHTFGPEGRRVQIIMLDTRYFRAPVKRKSKDFPHWGKYEPDTDPDKTLLGAEQWSWLEAELRKPADVRLIVSSIQVLAEGHGFERWGNLPRERDRLVSLIATTRARGVVLVSGDRHMGALYARDSADGHALPELTSSSLNKSFGPSRDARTPELKSAPYHPENFGLIDIDWDARTLTLRLLDIAGNDVARQGFAFDALATPLPLRP